MKNVKSLLLLAAGFICVASPAGAQQVTNKLTTGTPQIITEVKAPVKTVLNKDKVFARPVMAAPEDIMRLPQKVTNYVWDGTEWQMYNELYVKYDDYGKQLENKYLNYEMGVLTPSYDWTYTYDDQDRLSISTALTKADENSDWVNFRKSTNEYDDVVKDYVILYKDYFWDEGIQDWTINGGYYNQILRDEDNRVYYKQTWSDETQQEAWLGQQFQYDEEGNPTVMIYYAQDEATKQPVPVYYYNDIEWEKTNYQFIDVSNQIFTPFESDPNNSASHFNVYRVVEVTESGINAGMVAIFNKRHTDNAKIVEITYAEYTTTQMTIEDKENKTTDIYFYEWTDNNGNGVYDDGEFYNPGSAVWEQLKYDDHDNCILDATYYYNEETQQFEMDNKGVQELVYGENGEIIEYIVSFYDANEILQQSTKTVNSDFLSVTTGIEDMSEEKALKLYDGYLSAPNGIPYTICDLSGRTVKSGNVENNRITLSGMPAGMYIVRTAASALKVTVR